MMAIVSGLLKSGKFWVISGVVISCLAFAKWGYGEIYGAGYSAAELKWREAQQVAINAAVADERDKWSLAVKAAQENIRIETVIDERVRIVEREVPTVVERVVPSECRDLGPDIQRLFNDAIAASGNLQGEGAEPSAIVDE